MHHNTCISLHEATRQFIKYNLTRNPTDTLSHTHTPGMSSMVCKVGMYVPVNTKMDQCPRVTDPSQLRDEPFSARLRLTPSQKKISLA